MLKIEKFFTNSSGQEEKRVAFEDGNAPEFIEELESFILEKRNEIKKIYISLYLFNNKTLYHFLKRIVENCEIEVNIISIPLDGYDNEKEVNVKYTHGKSTKYMHAENLYKEIENNPLYGLNFYIFPHVYIRSSKVKKFSRGKMPCSLHIKSMYLDCGSNGYTILSTSNLAVCDYSKDDYMAILSTTEEDSENAKMFYKTLIENCIHSNQPTKVNSEYTYPLKINPCLQKSANNAYIAPFLMNSPLKFEEDLKSMIKSAEERIVICGQHVSAFSYKINNKFSNDSQSDTEFKTQKGFLSTLFEINENIDINVMSQTYAEKNRNLSVVRPANPENFENFIEHFKNLKNKQYFVKSGLHAKFIVVDNKVLLSTANFTATQFMYLPYVNIEHFENIPDVSYKGIFSEVGQYIIIEDMDFANKMVEWFANLSKSAIKVL